MRSEFGQESPKLAQEQLGSDSARARVTAACAEFRESETAVGGEIGGVQEKEGRTSVDLRRSSLAVAVLFQKASESKLEKVENLDIGGEICRTWEPILTRGTNKETNLVMSALGSKEA